MKYYLILIFLVLVSCEKDENPTDPNNEELDLSFTTVIQDQTSFRQSELLQVVFRSESDENNFFNEYATPNTIPWEVDYDEEMVIGLVMPEQSTGSNVIEITGLEQIDDDIQVSSKFTIAGIGNDMIGYPNHFIKLNKYNNQVTFNKIDTVYLPINSELAGTSWRMVSATDTNNNRLNFQDPNSNAFIDFSLSFEESTFTGTANCNSIGGNYELQRQTISFTEMWGTEAACELSWEFQESLMKSAMYQYTNAGMVIYSSGFFKEMNFLLK